MAIVVKCVRCGRTKSFPPCTADKRRYCSRHCYDEDKREGKVSVANQYGSLEVWTKAEDVMIRRRYPSCVRPKLLAKELGRTVEAVRKRASFLGVERDPEAISEGYASGGRLNKGRKRPDFAKNAYRGSGPDNPFYGKTHTAESRLKISEAAKRHGTFRKLAKNPEFQRRRMEGLHKRPNNPEKLLTSILDKEFPNEYKFTGDGSFIIDGLNPDFVNVNGQKKIIEVFGEAYHDPKVAKWKVSPRATVSGRRKAFKQFGYTTLIVWSQELYKGGDEGRERLLRKIRRFHENCSH